MKNTTFSKKIALLITIFLPWGVQAEMAQSMVPIGATIQPACVVHATNLNFGVYTGKPIAQQNYITVGCIAGTYYTITLNQGLSNKASLQTRQMRNDSSSQNTINYSLYLDASHQNVWGDGTGGTSMLQKIANGQIERYAVYGLIFPNQNVAAGVYHDTISVNVEF